MMCTLSLWMGRPWGSHPRTQVPLAYLTPHQEHDLHSYPWMLQLCYFFMHLWIFFGLENYIAFQWNTGDNTHDWNGKFGDTPLVPRPKHLAFQKARNYWNHQNSAIKPFLYCLYPCIRFNKALHYSCYLTHSTHVAICSHQRLMKLADSLTHSGQERILFGPSLRSAFGWAFGRWIKMEKKKGRKMHGKCKNDGNLLEKIKTWRVRTEVL